ncbi:MAG: lysophospholipid acyltransferase family protein [Armatimonadota bacterium]|nr:lysophospholipid acyltransferase family protein [Armatimonadota bacterium]
MLYKIGKILAILVCWFFGRWQVIGRENIPKTGGVLLCANHVSYVDPPVLGAGCPRRVYFMAKEPLFRIPVLGCLIRKVGAFPVKTHSPDRAAIRKAVELLSRGECVAMFPEGTRNLTSQPLLPAEPGVGMIALMAKVPVIPAALINTAKLLPPHSMFLRFARVKVVYGKPVDLSDLHDSHGREAAQEVGNRIMAAIGDLLRQHQ